MSNFQGPQGSYGHAPPRGGYGAGGYGRGAQQQYGRGAGGRGGYGAGARGGYGRGAGGRGGYGRGAGGRGGYSRGAGGRGGYGAGGRGGHTQHYDPYGASPQQYGAQQYGGPEPPKPSAGTIKRTNERGFGFIEIDNQDVFFPAREVLDGKFDELKAGDEVICVVGPDERNPEKWQARQVRTARGTGTIDGLKNFFGFINSSKGERLFFHGRYVVGDGGFDLLKEGAKVEYRLAASRGGKEEFEAQDVKVVE